MRSIATALKRRTRRLLNRLPGMQVARRFESVANSRRWQPHVIERIDWFSPLHVRTEFPHATPTGVDYHMPSKAIWLMRDAMLWPALGAVMTPDGTVALESLFNSVRQHEMWCRGDFRLGSVQRVDGPCVSIQGGPGWANYYHWIVDNLPKIYALHHPRVRAWGSITVCVAGAIGPDLRQLIDALLPEDATIREFDSRTRVIAPAVIIVPPLAGNCAGYWPAECVTWFRERVAKIYALDPAASRNQRIFISRKLAAIRQISNEPDVLEALRPLGVEAHQMERYPMREQAALFHQAEWVIAPHGAGLTNLVFAQPQTSVLEVFNQRTLDHYRLLCAAFDHDYRNFIIGNGLGKDVAASFPVDRLTKTVSEMPRPC